MAILSTTMSAVVGSFAAYFKGWTERVSLWVIDLLLVLPSFIIIAVLVRNVSPGNGIWVLIVLLTLLGWMLTARVVRSLTMSVRDRDYVTAAKYMGVGGPRIVFRHIIPNISSLLIVDVTVGVAAAVLAETTLSFFGFGIRPPETSLGTLIGQGARQATTFPWIFYAGAIPLVLLVLSVNFMGDGLRDALDPTSEGERQGVSERSEPPRARRELSSRRRRCGAPRRQHRAQRHTTSTVELPVARHGVVPRCAASASTSPPARCSGSSVSPARASRSRRWR